MKYARIINNSATDVTVQNPAQCFHPIIAAEFVEVPDDVENGWIVDKEGNWSEPPVPEVPEPMPEPEPISEPEPLRRVSPIEFKLLFTAQERLAIKAARKEDPVIDDFYELVEDPRLNFVNLSLQSTQEALMYMALQGLITEERVPEILSGQFN